MISYFNQVLLFYFLSFAIFWINGGNKVEDENLCSDFAEQLSAMAKTVVELQGHINSIIPEIDELNMSRENDIYGAKRKSPNILEVKCDGHRLPSNCAEIDECHNHLYRVNIPYLRGAGSFPVSCDFKTEHAAWTVIQRRQDGSVNFYRNWTQYVHGFGDVDGEFFIGLEKLHALTTMGAEQQLYIILEDFEGNRKYANYSTFRVASKAKDYMLTVGGYSGDAGDCLSYHNAYKFSTWDRDNDSKCARRRLGGWWYSDCFKSNLNGKYLMGIIGDMDDGVAWSGFRGYRYSLRFTQMMIRPREN